MQSIGKLAASQASYYTEQLRHAVGEDTPVLRGDRGPTQRDYYTAHESPSRWMGRGIEKVGLASGSAVDVDVFKGLMNHTTPDGQAMTVARSHGKVAAFDHTFSAPKSVSLLYAFGDDRVRSEVTAAHQAAVAEGIAYMEDNCSSSRLGVRFRDAEGNRRFTTRSVQSEGYVAAAFDHFTSRANDPQVHTHVVVINRVWADEGWRAIDAKRGYAHAKAGGSVYQAALREELTRRLGVGWQPVVNGAADIAGFSPELIRHFSTRRSEIVEAVNRYVAEVGGEAHRRVWQTVTLQTRQPKSHPSGEAAVTREMKDYGVTGDVVAHWQRRAADAPDDVVGVVRSAMGEDRQIRKPDGEAVRAASQRLVEWVSDRQAVFTERDLVAHVSSLFPEGTRRDDLLQAAQRLLRTAQDSGDVLTVLPQAESGLILPDGVKLTDEEAVKVVDSGHDWIRTKGSVRFRALPGEARYTTRTQLERERMVLDSVKERSSIAPFQEALEQAIQIRELTNPQAAAVRGLAELPGRVVAVVGPGGSGKTYSIGAYADAIAAAGHQVVGVATAATAAQKLGEDLGQSWTGTIAMLRHQLEEADDSLRTGTLIVVDEASMVSTADLAWLVEQATLSDSKLVLVGDPMQLPSVDSGGLFHRIVASGDQVVDNLAMVNERQQLELDRALLAHIRSGGIARSVREYAEAGRLHLGRDEYATKSAMVDAWWSDVEGHGLEKVRMLSSRHDEVHMLNQLARVRVDQAGLLNGPSVSNRWGTEFRAGDRIVVRDNWYTHADLRNGQTGTVLSVDPIQGNATFQRDSDGEVIELPKRYVDRNVDHSYAQTIHTAQGQTFETTHLYVDTGVQAEHGYTALSRARGETHLWVNDAPGPLGECTHIHGDPLTDDRVAALVRQLSQSVVEAPALTQGVPVESAPDRQIVKWRDELEAAIRQSPVARNLHDEMVALDAAIAEAREVVERIGTSGAVNQLRSLELERVSLDDQVNLREQWLEHNSDILHRYSVVVEELNHRVNARVAAYEVDPPDELVEALGHPPADRDRQGRWIAATSAYAAVRIAVGDDVDLTDPALQEAAPWRQAVNAYDCSPAIENGVVLRVAR